MPILNHKWLFVLCCAISFLIAPLVLFAQEHNPYFTDITFRDGLPSQKVYYIHAAKNGMLYIAHSKGLSSFDGKVIKNFPNKYLPFTEVTNIMESEDGTIFCEAFNNNLFVLQNDTLVGLKYNPNKYGFKASAMHKSTIISQSNDSLILYNTKSNQYITKSITEAMFSEKKSNIVFAGFSEFNGSFYHYMVDDNFGLYKSKIANENLNAIHIYKNDVFSVNLKSVSAIYHWNKLEMISIQYPSFRGGVNYISLVDSVIWVCTTDGVFVVNNEQPVKHMYSGYSITSVVKTFDNTIFLATLGDGILKVPNVNLTTIYNNDKGISGLAFNKESLYIGTKDGCLIENSEIGSSNQVLKSFESPITSLVSTKDSKGALFNSNTFISWYNGDTKVAKFTMKDYQYLNEGILIATNAGLYYYSTTDPPKWINGLIRESKPPLYKLNIFDEYVATAKFNYTDSCFYINTYNGIYRYSIGTAKQEQLIEPHCVLSDMAVHKGSLFLATKDKGVLYFDGTKYHSYKPEIFRNRICLKTFTHNEELWILANDAIISIIRDSTTVYGSSVGIPFNLLQGFSVNDYYLVLHDGKRIFRLTRKMDNNEVSDKPKVNIISVYNLNRANELKQGATISHNENTIRIHFSLLSFKRGDNLHIAYRINNGELVHLSSSSREITLNNLAPDSYEIALFAIEGDNVIKETASRIQFTIKPPFYKTGYFTIMAVMLAACLVYLISRSILRRFKKEAAQAETQLRLQQELDKSILSSIKSQMNPHFLFNALNTIQSYIYTNDKTNASKYISKFSNLTRSILELSNKEYISIDDEITTLSLYLELEKMRFEESFVYTLSVDPKLNKEATKIPSMLVQPYVENAIKHGLLHKKTNRVLNITFSRIEDGLEIIIDDNGIGRKRSSELNQIKNRQHNSFAMNANKKRLEILKNNYKNIHFDIIDKYSPLGEAIGTKVLIILPLV